VNTYTFTGDGNGLTLSASISGVDPNQQGLTLTAFGPAYPPINPTGLAGRSSLMNGTITLTILPPPGVVYTIMLENYAPNSIAQFKLTAN
jgi:hypothetical protein